jgi:hypothetical protein
MGAKLVYGGYYACAAFDVNKFDKINKEHLQYSLKDYKISLSKDLDKLRHEVDFYHFLVNLAARFDSIKSKAKNLNLRNSLMKH